MTVNHIELEVRFKEHHDDCYAWALMCCNWQEEMAEEVLQESYLKALKSYDKFKENSSFKTWLFSIISKYPSNPSIFEITFLK